MLESKYFSLQWCTSAAPWKPNLFCSAPAKLTFWGESHLVNKIHTEELKVIGFLQLNLWKDY